MQIDFAPTYLDAKDETAAEDATMGGFRTTRLDAKGETDAEFVHEWRILRLHTSTPRTRQMQKYCHEGRGSPRCHSARAHLARQATVGCDAVAPTLGDCKSHTASRMRFVFDFVSLFSQARRSRIPCLESLKT